MTKVAFSINLYDDEGGVFDNCVLLHFGESAIIRLESIEDLKGVIESLNSIVKEIEESW